MVTGLSFNVLRHFVLLLFPLYGLVVATVPSSCLSLISSMPPRSRSSAAVVKTATNFATDITATNEDSPLVNEREGRTKGTTNFNVFRGRKRGRDYEVTFWGKILRRVTVFRVAFQFYVRYKWSGMKINRQKQKLGLTLDDPDSDDHPEIVRRWDAVHIRNAKILLESIQHLEGFWVKVGQYLSTRADILPPIYLQTLSVLQDSMPPRSWEDTLRTIQEEFGEDASSLMQRFESIDPHPLSTASLAQVHRATLKEGVRPVAGNDPDPDPGGAQSIREVVIKVQHRGVAQLMLQDMDNLAVILNLLSMMDPDLDFNPVIKEYNKEVRKELDFRTEAQNMVEIRNLLLKADIDVVVPEFCFGTERVLVMEFCSGFPIRDTKKLDEYDVNRELVLERVCTSWAIQMHVGGLFNADPHFGNILISTANTGRDNSVPVLLDFGLTKRLDPKMKLAFARLMYASHENDIDSLMRSFDEMGLKFNRHNPFEDMANMRRGFGSTVPQSKAKEVSKRKRLDWQRRTEARKVDAGLQKGQKLRSPVDAWPSELVFFGRVTNMLRGLCSRLDIQYPYLKTMATAARKTLCDSVPVDERAKDLIHPSCGRIKTPMQQRLVDALKQLNEEGHMIGLQVCVLQHGKEIVNIAAGVIGIANPRPVTPSTLFNVFSVTKGVLTIGLLRLVQEGRIKNLDDPVAMYWPKFESKPTVTVRHVLTHQSGLATSFPEHVTLDTLLDWSFMTKFFAEDAVPSHIPGEEFEYHALSFGWLVGGLIEAVTGESYENYFDQILQCHSNSEQSLEENIFLAGISGNVDDDKELAVVSLQAPILSQNQNEYDTDTNTDSTSFPSKDAVNFKARDNKKDNEESNDTKKVLDKYRGLQQLMNPSIFNMRQVREAKLPSANGHISAVALANVFDAVIRDDKGCYRGEPILSSTILDLARIPSRTTMMNSSGNDDEAKQHNSEQQKPLRYDNRVSFGLGFELFEFTLSNGEKAMAVGHNGLGGSVVLAIPEEQVVVSFTLNLLSMDSIARRRILGIIFDELGYIPNTTVLQ